jgi:hypothetical protein
MASRSASSSSVSMALIDIVDQPRPGEGAAQHGSQRTAKGGIVPAAIVRDARFPACPG